MRPSKIISFWQAVLRFLYFICITEKVFKNSHTRTIPNYRLNYSAKVGNGKFISLVIGLYYIDIDIKELIFAICKNRSYLLQGL